LRLEDIERKVLAYNKAADLPLLRRAYDFSARAHQGQVRKSGEPYLAHPLEVTGIIADLKLDVPSLCAGLLHDTVEDTTATVEQIESQFSAEIAQIVDGVTKLSKIQYSNKEQRQAENFRKMIVAMSRDIRVLLVKLADRTHNMRTLEHMGGDKQERIARETLEIYAPLANRLGIQWMKVELEDLSFRYLNPEAYESIAEKLKKKRRERERYIEEVIGILGRELERYGLEGAQVSGRPKHTYSIWKKMQNQGLEFEQLHDLVAFRIIPETVPQCYEALGLIHSLWKPIPGRFKDYIALPKPNLYQSLHTTVIGHNGERMEIQIRTHEMHRVAENGIAAHWVYKEGKAAPARDEQKFAWLRQLMEWQRELTDPTEFLETVRVDLFSDEVYVFTPKGDVMALPREATPVDFAYAIHTEIGNRCVGAKVNGRLVPLRYQLRNGDTLEILTSANQKPSKDWLKFVKTTRARAKIRHHVRLEQRLRSRELGHEILEKELRRYDLSWAKLERQKRMDDLCRALRVQTPDEILIEVGYGKIEPRQVLEKVLPPDRLAAPPAPEPKKEGLLGQILRRVVGAAQKTGIQVQGLDDVMVRFGKCCNPVPGDEIIGFITRGRGITVHGKHCQKGLDADPARRIEVAWAEGAKCQRRVSVKVVSVDKPGLLASMSQVFTEAGINIAVANCRTTDDHRAINTFEITINDVKQLKSTMRRIEQIDGVVSVERLGA
jgi:GTP pyrophosphokinase